MIVLVIVVFMSTYIIRREYLLYKVVNNKIDRYKNKNKEI